MSGAIDFVVAARNAGRDVMNDQARKVAAERAEELALPLPADPGTGRLCAAIRSALKALPHLPIGSRQPAGEALKKLALALDIAARCFSFAEGSTPAATWPAAPDNDPPTDNAQEPSRVSRELEPEDVPYRPGVDAKPPE
jgi:hypothetical protein